MVVAGIGKCKGDPSLGSQIGEGGLIGEVGGVSRARGCLEHVRWLDGPGAGSHVYIRSGGKNIGSRTVDNVGTCELGVDDAAVINIMS